MPTHEPIRTLASVDLRVAKPCRQTIRQHARTEQYYRDLAHRLRILRGDACDTSYVVGLTACSRKAGVSTVAAHLALSLAQSASTKCLLVDAHARYASLHKMFQVERSPGFLDIVAGQQDALDSLCHVSSTPNLYFLPAGESQDPNLFDPAVISESLDELRGLFNYIIVDMPPANASSDVIPIAGLPDAVLLVVEAERVRRHAALRTQRSLKEAGANIVGTVLSKRRKHIPNFIYRYI